MLSSNLILELFPRHVSGDLHRNVWLGNSGATLWHSGTMQLIEFYHLLFWADVNVRMCLMSRDFGKLLYEFYVFTEDSNIQSIGDVPCRVYLWYWC